MRILRVMHSEPEFPYNNEAFFARRGDEIEDLIFRAGQKGRAPERYSAVIVYGGYMSPFDDVGHPWIKEELGYLESCLKSEIPLLGICLGSQLLARVLGARVYRSPAPEFGFKRITLNEAGVADPVLGRLGAGSPDRSFLAIEWHSDAWDLPVGAVSLASSRTWENEAYRYGPRVLATQFHLEFTQERMAKSIERDTSELPDDPEGEDPLAFAAPGPRWEELRVNMEKLLEGFMAGCQG